MLKILFNIFVGNWCTHKWVTVFNNTFTRRESSANYSYDVTRHSILLRCDKCGKFKHKVV